MPAGREMDALIRQYVFGQTPPRKNGELTRSWVDGYLCEDTFYSTDIAAAWEVVEKLKMAIVPLESPDGWASHDNQSFDIIHGYYERPVVDWASATTAPLAICRAALLAIIELQE